MNQKELKELIDFLVEKDITEFELERGDVKVRVKRVMNEIESDVAGDVVKILVTNNQPIEYGQSLFAIRPR